MPDFKLWTPALCLRYLKAKDYPETARAAILRFLAEEISPGTYVNIMDQYYPAGKVGAEKYVEINRSLTRQEYDQAMFIVTIPSLAFFAMLLSPLPFGFG